jgi:hypothetical protein
MPGFLIKFTKSVLDQNGNISGQINSSPAPNNKPNNLFYCFYNPYQLSVGRYNALFYIDKKYIGCVDITVQEETSSPDDFKNNFKRWVENLLTNVNNSTFGVDYEHNKFNKLQLKVFQNCRKNRVYFGI